MTDKSYQVENGKLVQYDQNGNKEPVSTEALDTEYEDITNDAAPVLSAANRAKSGEGNKEDGFFANGLQQAVDDARALVADSSKRSPQEVLVDGMWSETVTAKQKTRLVGPGTWEARIDESSSDPIVDLSALDASIERITVRQGGNGPSVRISNGENIVKQVSASGGAGVLVDEDGNRFRIMNFDVHGGADALRVEGAQQGIIVGGAIKGANLEFDLGASDSSDATRIIFGHIRIHNGALDIRNAYRVDGGPVQVISGFNNVLLEDVQQGDLSFSSYGASGDGVLVRGGSRDLNLRGNVNAASSESLNFVDCFNVSYHGNASGVTFGSNANTVTVYAPMPSGNVTNNGTNCSVVN